MSYAINLSSITNLERETISLVSQGSGNKEIAEIQSCSVRSVDSRLRTIFYKLHVYNRAELVAKAFKTGLLSAAIVFANVSDSVSQSSLSDTPADPLHRISRISRNNRRNELDDWDLPDLPNLKAA